jgi:hypothetical protein
MSNPSARNNRLTFSLRGLFVGVTIIAVGSAAIWTAALPARREYAAAQSLISFAQSERKPGVKPAVAVLANAECKSVPSPNHTPPVVIDYQPAQGVDRLLCWIAGLPGHVEKVAIWQSDAAARCFFANAANFQGLEELSIYCDTISDCEIGMLVQCPGLGSITLACDELDGSELRTLGALPELTQLTVKSDSLDCGVFAAVGECRGLWSLQIEGPLGLESMPEARPLGRFNELPLVMLQISGDFPDVVLKHVADVGELTFLNIHSGVLTDSGVALLANNESIQHLVIDCEHITDASIDTLITMKALRQFAFDFRSGITAEGLRRLEAVRPDILCP